MFSHHSNDEYFWLSGICREDFQILYAKLLHKPNDDGSGNQGCYAANSGAFRAEFHTQNISGNQGPVETLFR